MHESVSCSKAEDPDAGRTQQADRVLHWPRHTTLKVFYATGLALDIRYVAGTERGIDRDTEYVLSLKPLD